MTRDADCPDSGSGVSNIWDRTGSRETGESESGGLPSTHTASTSLVISEVTKIRRGLKVLGVQKKGGCSIQDL